MTGTTDPAATGPAGAPARRAARARLALGILALAGLLLLARALDAPALLRAALDGIRGLGPGGAALFVVLYVLGTVLFLPGSVLTLGAGAVYGVVPGVLLVSLSATLGATAAFLVGRHLARDWVARRIEGRPTFRAIDEAVTREGWKIVGLARLSPVFPFTLLNYAFGVTRVSLRDYVLASWIGMLPGTAMYVSLGALAGDLAALGSAGGGGTRAPAEWALAVVGLVATLLVTVHVTRRARAALARRLA